MPSSASLWWATAEMRQLNAKYRKKNQTTDVLSFFVEDQPLSGAKILGDVVISVEQARRQAKERGKTLKSEMVTLLIHGILHLLGYDHEKSPRQAQIMFASSGNFTPTFVTAGY